MTDVRTFERGKGVSAYKTVAKAEDIPPGQTRHVDLESGTRICLANVNGTLYAIAAECSHQGGPLAEGRLEGTTITCPWHGAMFDVTSGEVLGPPANDPVPKYPVRMAADEVQVAVEPAGG